MIVFSFLKYLYEVADLKYKLIDKNEWSYNISWMKYWRVRFHQHGFHLEAIDNGFVSVQGAPRQLHVIRLMQMSAHTAGYIGSVGLVSYNESP